MAARKSEAEKAATRRARNQRYQASRNSKQSGGMKISAEAVAFSATRRSGAATITTESLFRPSVAAYPPGVVPDGAMANLAMDDAFLPVCAWAESAYSGIALPPTVAFLGFPHLAALALRPEHRKIVETIATEMTRRWIKIQSVGEDDAGEDKSEKIKVLNDAMDALHVRDVFRSAAEKDGYFGRAHIFPDFGDVSDAELQTSIGTGPDKTSKLKIKKGSLCGFRVIEPLWVYPQNYNASDPLSADWYKPQIWGVQGKKVHITRLLTIVGREVPDIFKPAFQFAGLSMTQIAEPYVDIFLKNRDSVSRLIKKFSASAIKTNLTDMLAGGAGTSALNRVKIFANYRDNDGILVLDKEAEDFFQVNTPLGTLDHLLAQSQEQIASIAGIPLVKLLGITPSGLNASSDGEVRCFYDMIHVYQEHLFSKALDKVFALVQLSEFGEVDPDLTYKFEPLWTLDEKEAAEVRQIEANTDVTLVQEGILLPKESRARIADDPESPYAGLVVEDIPDEPTAAEALGEPPAPGSGEQDDDQEADDPNVDVDAEADKIVSEMGQDAFEEGKHKRSPDGKFGSGGGAGKKPAAKKKPKATKKPGISESTFSAITKKVEGVTENVKTASKIIDKVQDKIEEKKKSLGMA